MTSNSKTTDFVAAFWEEHLEQEKHCNCSSEGDIDRRTQRTIEHLSTIVKRLSARSVQLNHSLKKTERENAQLKNMLRLANERYRASRVLAQAQHELLTEYWANEQMVEGA